MNHEIKQQVYIIISRVLEIRPENIRAESTWEEYNTDSFALVELVVALQEHFNIRFEPTELGDIKSVGDMVVAIEGKLKGSHSIQ